VHRATALCDEGSLQVLLLLLVFLRDIFKQNGYNDHQIHRALNHHMHLYQLDNKPNSPSCPLLGLYQLNQQTPNPTQQ
jgi:hypothetical protein